MYTIGQFSKIGKVSASTLRYYDEIDLLHPEYVDPSSQYRYYAEEQVPKIIFISELKEYGLRLEEIKVIMDKQDADLLKRFLANKVNEINREVEKNLELKHFIESKIKKIELGGALMELNKDLRVELKERQPLIVMSRRAVTNTQNISSVIGKAFEDIFKANLQPAGPVMTAYYDKEFDAENVDLEVCIPVNSHSSCEGIKEFAGGLHACCTFVGPYSKLGEAYAKVMKWIDENGYECTRAPFDIYLEGPRDGKTPEQFVTEVCFPISK